MSDVEKIFGSLKHRDWLLSVLKLHGIEQVDVEFAGSSDSGSLEGLSCTDKNGKEVNIDGITMLWPQKGEYWDDKTFTPIKTDGSDKEQSLEKVLNEITYEALDVAGLDWYNNDGGQGHFYIQFEDGVPKITLDIGINEMHTEEHEYDFSTDESEEQDASTSP